jgi:nitrogen fixation protein FixH
MSRIQSGHWWIAAVVAVLALTVAANIGLVMLAGDPDAGAVEPDYYAKGVAWDSTLAQERHDRDLGWTVDAVVGGVSRTGADIRLRLTDRDGKALDGADVRVEAIHNAQAGHRIHAVLPPAGDGGGAYAARLPLHRPGLWELRVTVRRAGEVFTANLRREVGVAPEAP